MNRYDSSKGNKLDNPYILMGILLFFWGSFAAVSKLTLNNMDSFNVQFYMFGFAFLIMTVILFSSDKLKKLRDLKTLDYLKLILFGIPQFLYYFLYVFSLKMIPTIEASALNYLFPVFIVLFAVPINGERLDLFKLGSLLISFFGVFVIITKGNIASFRLSDIIGDLMAIGAAVSWGLFSNLGRRNKLDTFISNYIYTLTAFVLATVSMFVFSDFAVPNGAGFLGSIWLCLSNIILTYYIWFKVLRIASSVLAANLSFFTPFVTLGFIVVLNGEKIMFIQIVGLLIILLGTAAQNEYLITKWHKVQK